MVKKGDSQSDPIIGRVRILRGQQVEQATLYAVDCSRECMREKALLTPAVASAAAVLLCGEGVSESLKSGTIQKMSKTGVVLVCNDDASVQTIIEEVSDILLELERWDNLLSRSTFVEPSVKNLLLVGEAGIPELLGITDPEMNVIFGTKNGLDPERRGTIVKEDGALRVATGIAEELLIEDNYSRAAEEKDVFLYPFDSEHALYVCANIFSGERYCARITADRPPGLKGFGLQGFETLFAHFIFYLRRCFLGEFQDEQVLGLRERARRKLRQLVENSDRISPDRIFEIARDCMWPADGTFVVAKAQFIEGSYWSNMANFLSAELEQTVVGSSAAALGTEVVWICHLGPELKADESILYEKLAYVIRDYTCKMGISRHLDGVEQIPFGFKEAQIALRLGQREDPHYWCYRFENYVSQYLFDQMTSELPVDQLIKLGLEKLVEYDERNGTSYLSSLRLYFDCGFNVTQAAVESCVHRTTFARRLNGIIKVSGLNVHDPKVRLDLTLSFWMLDASCPES